MNTPCMSTVIKPKTTTQFLFGIKQLGRPTRTVISAILHMKTQCMSTVIKPKTITQFSDGVKQHQAYIIT